MTVAAQDQAFVCSRCGGSKLHVFKTKPSTCETCRRIRMQAKHKSLWAYFDRTKRAAKERGLTWTLTFTEYSKFRAEPCFYCDHPVVQNVGGLDRLDSSRGYEVSNVVSCCRPCNVAKADIWTPGEFLEIGAVIKRLKRKRIEQGQPAPNLFDMGHPRPKVLRLAD